MAWLIGLTLLAVAMFSGVEIDGNTILIASGLFGIAGAIAQFSLNLKDMFKKE